MNATRILPYSVELNNPTIIWMPEIRLNHNDKDTSGFKVLFVAIIDDYYHNYFGLNKAFIFIDVSKENNSTLNFSFLADKNIRYFHKNVTFCYFLYLEYSFRAFIILLRLFHDKNPFSRFGIH